MHKALLQIIQEPGIGTRSNIASLSDQLALVADRSKSLEAKFTNELERVHPDFDDSARNLIAYLALRHVDLRDLQKQLMLLGLSSLGRAECNVIASISTVQKALRKVCAEPNDDLHEERRSFQDNEYLRYAHSRQILGRVSCLTT